MHLRRASIPPLRPTSRNDPAGLGRVEAFRMSPEGSLREARKR
jgi:hypothetical protein